MEQNPIPELISILNILPATRKGAPSIVFVTGASGAGKTFLIDATERTLSHDRLSYIRFDSAGVPTFDQMIEKYGSCAEWQSAMTIEWVRKFSEELLHKQLFIFEGQFNLDFAKKACELFKINNLKFVVLNVSDSIMTDRLTQQRRQPELVTEDMKNWSEFLKEQGKTFNATIIDTSKISIDSAVQTVLSLALDTIKYAVQQRN